MYSDKELLNLVKRDSEAFRLIVQKYQRSVRNYIYYLVKDTAYVDDITQESFIRLYDNLNKIDERGIKSYLFSISHNLAVNQLKKMAKFDTSIDIDKLTDRSTADLWIYSEESKVEKSLDVKQSLDKMKQKYRLVLYLYYIEDFSYKEISDMLKKPINTVKTWLRRAKLEFKQYYST